jgi:hypothetical protein
LMVVSDWIFDVLMSWVDEQLHCCLSAVFAALKAAFTSDSSATDVLTPRLWQ